jgi:streptogramin lyase
VDVVQASTGITGGVRLVSAFGAATLLGIGAQLVTATAVGAQPPAITGYSFNKPSGLIETLLTGPDGALWFTWDQGSEFGLSRSTVGGTITNFPTPPTWGAPVELGLMTTGAGSLWISERHDNNYFIGRWSTAGTLLAEFQVPTYAYAMAFGPDGNIWFSGATVGPGPGPVSNGCIGRMTPTGTVATFSLPDASSLAAYLTVGPDGNLWFTEQPGPNLGRVNTAGTITEFPIPGSVSNTDPFAGAEYITAGSDGAMWFAGPELTGVHRSSTSGAITAYSTPEYRSNTGQPAHITAGPDGNLWFTVPETGKDNWVGRMTTSGAVTAIYPIPADVSTGLATVITTGPDGALWFGEQGVLARLDPSIAPPAPIPDVPATGGGGALIPGALTALAGATLLIATTRRRHQQEA